MSVAKDMRIWPGLPKAEPSPQVNELVPTPVVNIPAGPVGLIKMPWLVP